MSKCDADQCGRPDDSLDVGDIHIFSGYGWFMRYHPHCCPIKLLGEVCWRCMEAGRTLV